MRKKYLERWIVKVGNKEFILNEEELNLLKEIDKQGQRGIVWFGDFAISIPHIEYISLISRLTPEESVKFTMSDYEEIEENGKIVYKRKKK